MRRRMGRPGLVGTMARTAVITGTASATMNAMAPKQHMQQPPVAAPQQVQSQPAAPAMTDETIAKLKQLGDLHASGVLSADEFAAAKAQLLR